MLDKLKKLFVQEVTDLLNKVEKDLLVLETETDNIELIQNIFRTMHTIKGSAGVYNLEKTILIAHNFETLFDSIKNKDLKISKEIISVTLQARDVLLKLIEAESEDVVKDKDVEKLISKIEKFKVLKPGQSTSEDNQNFNTLYILFEPNIDIADRGINIDEILKDFEGFEFKIITEHLDPERNKDNKHEKYYEIILSSNLSSDEIKAIFLFVPNEYLIKEISDINIMEKDEFIDFYENAVKIVPEYEQRLELLINFGSLYNSEDVSQTESEEQIHAGILIGDEEREEEIDFEKQQVDQIRVPAEKLDELLNLVSELIISNSQLAQSTKDKEFDKIISLSEHIGKITNTIKENTLNLRLIPVQNIIAPYKRLIRDLSLRFNKKIYFMADGVETLVDKNIIEKLFTPLSHIIRNAIDHGIESPEERIKKGKGETGIIRFIAFYSSTNVFVQIQDDGRGIDPEKIKEIAVKLGIISPTDKLSKKEIYELLFVHGFTTAKNVTEISGRGVGMDAIKKSIQDLRGDVEIDSEIELGTSVTIKLPLTISIVETMHLTAGKMNFLLPLANIIECRNYDFSDYNTKEKNSVLINDEVLPVIDICNTFDLEKQENYTKQNLIVISHGQEKIGLVFNSIEGEYQAVIKGLGSVFRQYDYFIGASILADGSIGYILDSYKLINNLIKKS